MTLKIYLDNIEGVFGARYMVAYRALKQYLDSISDEQFRNELGEITSPRHFSYLMAAGLSRERQHMISERWNELIKEAKTEE